METSDKTSINIETTVLAPVGKVWKFWSEQQHITKWKAASDDWHTPYAENENPIEIQKGGWQAILNNFKKYTEASK
jgi:uncharacterized protein YndB with AHSA1/START domain